MEGNILPLCPVMLGKRKMSSLQKEEREKKMAGLDRK